MTQRSFVLHQWLSYVLERYEEGTVVTQRRDGRKSQSTVCGFRIIGTLPDLTIACFMAINTIC